MLQLLQFITNRERKMRTPEEKHAWYMQAMGQSEESLIEMVEESFGDPDMLAMSILSDAQHVLEYMDDKETARQYMNKAKWVIQRYWKIPETRGLRNFLLLGNSL
jgi:hypothetical protein